MPAVDDQSTRARIRDATIASIARHGAHATTARVVAEAAEVSAGSVIHHFGSMAGLRRACDHHVAEQVRSAKQAAMAQGTTLDPLAALRDGSNGTHLAYLARRLTEDAAEVDGLVDELVEDAEEYLATGVDSGMVRHLGDLHGTAVVLTLWSLGPLALSRHLRRLLGVDLTDADAGPEELLGYALPATRLLARGLFTEAFAARIDQVLPDGRSPTGSDRHPPRRGDP